MSVQVNKIQFNFDISIDVNPKNKAIFYVEGRVLRLRYPLQEISAADFWLQFDKIAEDKCWESLDSGLGQSVPREKVLLFSQLRLEIPPADLKALDNKISLDDLSKLASADIQMIHRAARLGNISLMEKAWKAGDSLDAICFKAKAGIFKNQYPLLITFQLGYWEVFEWLLKNGADPSRFAFLPTFWDRALENREWMIPIFKRYAFVNTILKKEMREDTYSCSSLHYAAEQGNKEKLDFLLECGADIDLALDAGGYTPLSAALLNQQLEIGEHLILRGAALSKGFSVNSILSCAVGCRSLGLVEVLLQRGACYKGDYRQHPMHLAIEQENNEMIQLLAQWGFKAPRETIIELFKEGSVKKECICLLLKLKVLDVNIKSEEGTPLLHSLILTGEQSLVTLVLDNGQVDLTAIDSNGMTALHVAACLEQTLLVQELIKIGANPNRATPTLITPLHIAAMCGFFPIIEILVQAGANVGAVDYENCTPYHRSLLRPPAALFPLISSFLSMEAKKRI